MAIRERELHPSAFILWENARWSVAYWERLQNATVILPTPLASL
jgi:hypothetical protein